MGLGFVELILETEERFGIGIPDPVAGKLRTPRQLIDHVVAAVGATDEGPCATQHAFYRVRGALLAVSPMERRRIGPKTPLEDVLPRSGRKRAWHKVQTATRARRMGMERPPWVSWSIAGTSAATFLGTLAASRPQSVAFATLMASIPVAVGVAATRPLATRLPGTIGDLARAAVPVLATEQRDPSGPRRWTRSEVAETVRQIIREQSGVKEFSDDEDFVRDLDLG